MVCQIDIMASVAALLNQPLKGTFDSQNILPALLGKSKKGRTELVVEANAKMALRYKNWAMIPPYKGPQRNETGNELGNLSDYGLYNLTSDEGQINNVATKKPRKLEKLKSVFFDITKGYYKSKVEEIKLK